MKEILAQSKFKMAEFYYKKRKNYPAARVFYNEAITVAPNPRPPSPPGPPRRNRRQVGRAAPEAGRMVEKQMEKAKGQAAKNKGPEPSYRSNPTPPGDH